MKKWFRLGVGARRQRPAPPVDGDGFAAGAHVPRVSDMGSHGRRGKDLGIYRDFIGIQ